MQKKDKSNAFAVSVLPFFCIDSPNIQYTQIAKFMGHTWVLSAPDGPHVGPMNLAIRVLVQCVGQDLGLVITVYTDALGPMWA